MDVAQFDGTEASMTERLPINNLFNAMFRTKGASDLVFITWVMHEIAARSRGLIPGRATKGIGKSRCWSRDL